MRRVEAAVDVNAVAPLQSRLFAASMRVTLSTWATLWGLVGERIRPLVSLRVAGGRW